MENPKDVFSRARYAEVRIDLAKNFPVTIYGDAAAGRKTRKLSLSEAISSEDLPLFISQIESVLAGRQTVLQAHARIKSDGENSFFLVRCNLKKEKFGKTHLEGFVFDVSAYLEFAGEDMTLLEYKRKTKEKIDLISSREIKLIHIIDEEYLKELQAPLVKGGVFSAVFDENENLICSAGLAENASLKKQKFVKRAEIKISHTVAAYWVITANKPQLIEENAPLLDVLVSAVTKIANLFVTLYNEIHNAENANKLLSRHIEQQILINNIYSIILERKDAEEAIGEVLKLTGEFMGMKRVCIYDDYPEEKRIRKIYQWRANYCLNSAPDEYCYSALPKIMERLDYTDIYLPPNLENHEEFSPGCCTVANLNGDGRRLGIMSFAPRTVGYVPTLQESNVLRSVSQIVAMLIMRKRADEKLLNYAFFDRIIEAPSRAKLDEDLSLDLENGVKGAAAALKITNLHTYNELFGHDYTDVMLRDMARYISDLPEAGFAVYRFSGNTLMLLLRESDEERVKRLISELTERFGKPWKHQNGEHYLDVCIGVAFYPRGLASLDAIYRAADLAMYKAAEYSANSYAFYSEDFKTEADANYARAQKLRAAISGGMKGFSLIYQPCVSLDGEPLHYEALARRDGIPAARLISLAENMGLDIAVDSWVMKTACDFCKKAQEYKSDFSVSVNITPRVLRSGAVIGMVKDALEETGLDGSFLSLEIPERTFSDRQDGVLSILKKLKKTGVKLIIDSFGSDYGGLRLLKHSMMDMVKMDFSLFTEIFGEFDEIWVNAAARLAASLENGICVKRVEEKEQLEKAKESGVKYAQGNLFVKPATGEEILKKLQKNVRQR